MSTSGGASVLGQSPERFRVALIGSPVGQSLSPQLHEAAYAALGLDWRYGAFDVGIGNAAVAIRRARDAGYVGLSVTTPLKVEVVSAGSASVDVEAIGAANTVTFSEGEATLHNTDGEGLLDDLGTEFGFEVAGSRCAVIGAGATGRAVIRALALRGAGEIVIVNRSEGAARAAARIAPTVARPDRAEELGGCELVVYAALPADRGAVGELARFASSVAEHIDAHQLVVDVNYIPAETVFLAACRERGARTRSGLGMLVCQAARQVELFTGEPAPIEAMWAAVAMDRATSTPRGRPGERRTSS